MSGSTSISRRLFGLGAACTSVFLSQKTDASTQNIQSYGRGNITVTQHDGAIGSLIYIHGDGWREKPDLSMHAKPAFAKSLGLNFISLEYPTLPNISVARQIAAIEEALLWLNRQDRGADLALSKSVILGYCAGAHLGAMAVLGGNIAKPAGLIVNDTGACDLAILAKNHGGQLPNETRAIFPDPHLWDALSPARIAITAPPPTMVIWSRAKGHQAASLSLVLSLKSAGGDVVSFDRSNMAHSEIDHQIGTGNAPKLDQALGQFITQVLI